MLAFLNYIHVEVYGCSEHQAVSDLIRLSWAPFSAKDALWDVAVPSIQPWSSWKLCCVFSKHFTCFVSFRSLKLAWEVSVTGIIDPTLKMMEYIDRDQCFQRPHW